MPSNMTFKANLIPNENLKFELGSSDRQWKINGSADPKLTDENVAQNNSTEAKDFRVLLSGSDNDAPATEGTNKSTNLRFNPSTKIFSVGGSINATGDLTITGNTNLNSETYAESITAGSLLVNGAANFVNIPTAPTPEATSNDTSIATTAFVMNAFTANNVDSIVYKGTNTFTDSHIIIADGTTGKVKDSGKTITTTAPSSSAADTTIPTSKAVWSAISGASGYGKTGTVTKVSTGVGLTGGDITGTGTIKAKLKVETAFTADSAAQTNTASRQYMVGVDKSGYLSVNIPWTDTDTKQNITLSTTSKAFITGITTTPTATAQALTGIADTGVYLTATSGELSAVRHSFNSTGTEKAYIAYNTTTNALDFVFV